MTLPARPDSRPVARHPRLDAQHCPHVSRGGRRDVPTTPRHLAPPAVQGLRSGRGRASEREGGLTGGSRERTRAHVPPPALLRADARVALVQFYARVPVLGRAGSTGTTKRARFSTGGTIPGRGTWKRSCLVLRNRFELAVEEHGLHALKVGGGGDGRRRTEMQSLRGARLASSHRPMAAPAYEDLWVVEPRRQPFVCYRLAGNPEPDYQGCLSTQR